MKKPNARRNIFLALALLVVCALSLGNFFQTSNAQKRTRGVQAAPSRAQNAHTRLVLLIVVDQFRYDYLERFGDLFVANGIRRLTREGASWSEANYDHSPTYTAPGHATLMTGTWPSENGIVANNWFERETGKRVSSVTDDDTLLLGGKEGEKGSSPRRLLSSTLGDELRLASNDRSKVIGISVKNRSAILPAGRRANAAYWFNLNNGNMVSSSYYFNRLPAWVERFNAAHMADKFYGARWDRLLPESEYLKRAGADAPAWEDIDTAKDTNTFPHIVTGGAKSPDKNFYKALDYAPFSNDILVAFAKQAVENESLGEDDDTDFLSVSFSCNDYIGHRFGPYSQEMMDVTLRVDRQIAELLEEVDKRVGLRNTLVVFTADHGVAPIPEHAAAINLPGRRIKKDDVLKAINAAIKERYGRGGRAADDYIQKFKYNNTELDGFINGNIYFNQSALKRDGVSMEELARVAGEAAMSVAGTARYFTRGQLEAGSIPPMDVVARRMLHGFHPQRSGDLVILYQPFSILFGDPDDPADPRDAATHGSPYSYDTHVPLIIMGNSLQPGRYIETATPADIAPTLANILGIQAPSNATGRVLVEGIKR
ncbi:MAG TPA: alkaline phosphatase family protein [Pyrinomonadaceae bacterium]|jgi:predicted AlkP superfamily pyrophosphatase or phosphodiesterase